MKKLFSLITIVSLIGMLVVVGVKAADTAPVTATVTVQSAAVSVNNSSFGYGTVLANTASTTIVHWAGAGITATNDGSLADFDIYGAHTGTGAAGNGWDLDTATTTADHYIHWFCKDTDVVCTTPPTNYTGNELTTSPALLKASVAASGTSTFQLQIGTPNPRTKFPPQSAVVTVQASAL